jgi:hypothetical protein
MGLSHRFKVSAACLFLVLAAAPVAAEDADPPPIPAANAIGQKAPVPAPGMDASKERVALLIEAIRKDKPEIALPLFFPADAFDQVKAIKDPGRYHRKLVKVYLEDVRALRKGLDDPDNIELVSVELGRQRRWMKRGAEGNNYPYWAMYKAKVTVKDGARTRVLPLRVMINWGDQWYVTHLTRK